MKFATVALLGAFNFAVLVEARKKSTYNVVRGVCDGVAASDSGELRRLFDDEISGRMRMSQLVTDEGLGAIKAWSNWKNTPDQGDDEDYSFRVWDDVDCSGSEVDQFGTLARNRKGRGSVSIRSELDLDLAMMIEDGYSIALLDFADMTIACCNIMDKDRAEDDRPPMLGDSENRNDKAAEQETNFSDRRGRERGSNKDNGKNNRDNENRKNDFPMLGDAENRNEKAAEQETNFSDRQGRERGRNNDENRNDKAAEQETNFSDR